MLNLKKQSDTRNPHSLLNRMRSRRFRLFESLTKDLPRPLRIIDLGGTVSFWEQRGWTEREGVHITVVNLEEEDSPYTHVLSRAGDATNLHEFADKSFDIAFSNSVIEHLQWFDNQVAMANEVRRVAKAYFVQTPNYWFPIEPHYQLLGWQWYPEHFQVWLLQRRYRRRCNGLQPHPDLHPNSVRQIRLLTKSEVQVLFPDAIVWPERYLGLVKSWTAYAGFPDS